MGLAGRRGGDILIFNAGVAIIERDRIVSVCGGVGFAGCLLLKVPLIQGFGQRIRVLQSFECGRRVLLSSGVRRSVEEADGGRCVTMLMGRKEGCCKARCSSA